MKILNIGRIRDAASAALSQSNNWGAQDVREIADAIVAGIVATELTLEKGDANPEPSEADRRLAEQFYATPFRAGQDCYGQAAEFFARARAEGHADADKANCQRCVDLGVAEGYTAGRREAFEEVKRKGET